MSTDYRPIACGSYSTLEVLVLQQTELQALCAAPDGTTPDAPCHGQAIDLRTQAGAEYLILRDLTGTEHPLRLDRLRQLTSPCGTPLWP